jgi:UDP-N-acetylglucosamine--N-acetylmuramyl-(pentapeptide) pyrophosphoryl-undecaprenol N-acetylglucosamine transferase
VYPALTIIRALQQRRPDAEVLFIGTREGLEADIVPRAGIRFQTISAGGMNRKSPAATLKGLLRTGRGLAEAMGLLRRFRPHAVVGTGGYVCGPVVLSARLLGVPTAIQEQNVIPGVTNRILARFAGAVFAPFPEARRHFPARSRVVVTGNPIRPEIVAANRERVRKDFGLETGRQAVLVLGGSRGARALNRAVLDDLEPLLATRDVFLLWATGKEYYDSTAESLKARGIPLDSPGKIMVKPYLYNIEEAYAAADLVVGRAGGGAVAEVAARGLPSIIIPSPNVTNDHQEHNARVLESRGAALVLREMELAPGRLARAVADILGNPARLREMGEKSLAVGRPQAAERIVDELLKLCRV